MNPVFINSIGLGFDIVGALMIWKYVPSLFEANKNGDVTPTDMEENERILTLSKRGIILIVIGFVLQFASGIIPLIKCLLK